MRHLFKQMFGLAIMAERYQEISLSKLEALLEYINKGVGRGKANVLCPKLPNARIDIAPTGLI